MREQAYALSQLVSTFRFDTPATATAAAATQAQERERARPALRYAA